MTTPRRLLLTVAVLFLALNVFTTAKAEARKRLPIPAIINTGDVIYRVADLPPELDGNPEFKGWALGYKASHFGLLWADIACWDKQLVAFKDDTYADLPPELRTELEARFPWGETERGPWTRFGFFGMCAALIGGGLLKRLRGES